MTFPSTYRFTSNSLSLRHDSVSASGDDGWSVLHHTMGGPLLASLFRTLVGIKF